MAILDIIRHLNTLKHKIIASIIFEENIQRKYRLEIESLLKEKTANSK